MDKGHYRVSMTTTTPWPALYYPNPLPTSILPSSNDVVVFLHVTTGELLPTFCKRLSTLFPTEKDELCY